MEASWEGILAIRLLGGWQVTAGGEPVRGLQSRAEQRLLAWLALHAGDECDREMLAGTFWPDSAPDRGLFYLRRGLSDLRKILGAESVRIHSPTSRTLALNPVGARIDVLEFDEAIARGDADSLKRAAVLYRGPLLPEWADEWLLGERASRERVYLDALERLGAIALDGNTPEEAVGWLRRAVAADPSRETAQRALLQSLAAIHDYAGMTQAYRAFRLYLHDELNAAPDPETLALYQRLQAAARERAAPAKPASQRASQCAATISPARKLPTPLSPLIGRESELERLSPCIRGNRLLTLTGAGGVGKTRLAIALAEEVENDFADGVWFVDLAPLSAGAGVGDTVASALGIREVAEVSMLDVLQDRLESQALLLILDNCEHVLASAASTAEALGTHCPRLTIVTTSREPLGVPGEVCWRVPSLALPALRDPTATERTLECASVRLFVDRAQRAAPGWSVDDSNVGAVAHICRRLDGIPLAIELAAARVRVLSVKQLAERLDDRFRLLTTGSRAALPRHQTLQALIDWSYDLLTPAERAMVNRLSVFAGGCTLEAAENVCRGGEIEEQVTLDLLSALVDKSLLIKEEDGGDEDTRYRMLETVREYAAARLKEAGKPDSIRDRHLAFFLDLAERAGPELFGPSQSEAHRVLEREHDNIRVALDWSRNASPEIGLRMVASLWRFWHDLGYIKEGREHAAAALARETGEYRAAVRANALFGLAGFMYLMGDLEESRRLLEGCRNIRASQGDSRGEALAAANLSMVARSCGDYALARAHIANSLAYWREDGDRLQLGRCLTNLGVTANEQRDFQTSKPALDEALKIADEIGIPQERTIVQLNLGNALLWQGDLDGARRLYREVLSMTHEMHWYPIQYSVLESFAQLADAAGDHSRCVTLMGALSEFSRRTGMVLPRNSVPATQALLDKMRAALDDAAFRSAWTKGCEMSPEEAATYALEQ